VCNSMTESWSGLERSSNETNGRGGAPLGAESRALDRPLFIHSGVSDSYARIRVPPEKPIP
jgi:hypothetical protein